MRSNSPEFNDFNQSSLKELRLVVVIDFPTPLVLTSHVGIANIPAGAVNNVLKDVSSISQRLIPDEGRSEIGRLSFSVVDINGSITSRFRTEQDAGEGLKGRKVELFRGGAGLDWSDFRIEQTQQVDRDVTFSKGTYKIQCADIQREMRKDVFDLAKTRLSVALDAGATTIDVFDTSQFEPTSHVASFTDSPTGSFYYLKLKYKNGFEIIKATGKTAITFTGLTRGMFGTEDVAHALPSGSDADSGIEVEEYVYLELPAPAAAYAILTGTIIGGGTIPTRWHLGISTSLIDQPSFEEIGGDWFDSSAYAAGLIFRFQALTKTDGKRFIEREICLLAGAFLRIGADGKISMRRMTGVIASADFAVEIGVDNAISHGPVKHDLSRVRNTFDIEWSYIDIPGETKPRFVRRDVLTDTNSIGIHGEGKPLALQFKGLHNERHTFTTLSNRFDSLRDRYSGPPLMLSVDLLPSLNDVEIGDIARVVFPNVQDFTAAGTLDRSFEVQRLTVNQKTGRVTADLFGSSLPAQAIADSGAGGTAELPDSWYPSAGTELGTVLTINGSGILQANGTLNGGTLTRTIFYYLGDFTIASGRTLTITGNVELRIRGHFQNNGTLKAQSGRAANSAGFIGVTFGGRGVLFDNNVVPIVRSVFAATRVVGRNSAMPVFEIENDGGVLNGIPADMRGSGGGTGGAVQEHTPPIWFNAVAGGGGGVGGGSIVTVSRGAGYGVSGTSVLSGTNGSVGGSANGNDSGSGGGGAPGSLLHLLDGSAVSVPLLAGNIIAKYGTSPITASNSQTQGKALASDPIDLGIAAARIAFVPNSRVPYNDFDNNNLTAGDGNSVLIASVYLRKATAPTTPIADDGSYNFGTNVLTAPSIAGGSADNWSATVPAGTDPLYVTTGTFEVNGTSGIDSTVTWADPTILAQDGSTGATGSTGADGSNGQSDFVGLVYRRAASAPATPTGGQYNFATNTLTAPTGWFTAPPAGTDPLYVSTASFSVIAPTTVDNTTTWTSPDILVQDGAAGSTGATGSTGAAGSDGTSVHVANIFRRASSSPATPAVDDGSYNFTTKVLTPPAGWSVSPPAGGEPLYVSTGSFSIVGTTGTDSTVTWTAPDLLVQDGASAVPDFTPGHIGGSSDFVYTLNASVGGAANDGEIRVQGTTFEHPDGSTITTDAADMSISTFYEGTEVGGFFIMFSAVYAETRFDGVAFPDWNESDSRFISVTNDPVNGWRARNNGGTFFAFTPIATDAIIAVCNKIASSGGIETIVPLTSGIQGAAGNSVHVSTIYLRSASAPATPTGGSYNFGTNTLTAPSGGWTEAIPAAGPDPLYSSTATWSVSGTTGTDSSTTWSAPVQTDSGALTIGDIADFSVSDSGFTLNQEADFRVLAAGTIQSRVALGTWATEYTWIGNGVNTAYEYKIHVEGDPKNSGGTEDAWILGNIGSSYFWVNSVSLGTESAAATLSFRDAATNQILGSIIVSITAADL